MLGENNPMEDFQSPFIVRYQHTQLLVTDDSDCDIECTRGMVPHLYLYAAL